MLSHTCRSCPHREQAPHSPCHGRTQHPLRQSLQGLRGVVLLLYLDAFLSCLFPGSLAPVAQEIEHTSPCLEILLNRTGKEMRTILIRG